MEYSSIAWYHISRKNFWHITSSCSFGRKFLETKWIKDKLIPVPKAKDRNKTTNRWIIYWHMISTTYISLREYTWCQMETFLALLATCAGNSPFTGDFPSQRPSGRALMFSLICAWTSGWANNTDAGDLKRHRAHCDVTVIKPSKLPIRQFVDLSKLGSEHDGWNPTKIWEYAIIWNISKY